MKTIYLAGGCFWGVEKYISGIDGVVETNVGYANGSVSNPSYEQVCKGAGHAETVRVAYDESIISLRSLLGYYYRVIDPVSLNRQGGDEGVQYRTGIYYADESDKAEISASLDELQKTLDKPHAIELKPIAAYYPAEEYHQKYLEKNPNGYCHINLDNLK